MDFTVKKIYLEAVLDRLMAITVKSTQQDRCASFGFAPVPPENKEIVVLRFNGEVAGVVRLPLVEDKSKGELEDVFFVKDSYLYNLVKNLPTDAEVTFSKRKNKVEVSSGTFKATWLLWESPNEETVKSLISINAGEDEPGSELGIVDRKAFIDVVGRVVYAVPKFTFQVSKQRIVLTKDGGKASDLFSCYQEVTGKDFKLKEEVQIPIEAFPVFKFAKSSVEKKIEIRERGDKYYFILGTDCFIYNKQALGFDEGTMKQNLPEDGLVFLTEVGRLKSLIERVGAVDEEKKIIEFDLSDKSKIKVSASDKLGNRSTETVPISLEGPGNGEAKKVDCDLLKSALGSVKEATISVGFRGNYMVLSDKDSFGVISLVQ